MGILAGVVLEVVVGDSCWRCLLGYGSAQWWRVSGGDRGSQKKRRLVVGTGGVTKVLTTSGADRGAHESADDNRWGQGGPRH